MTSKALKDFVRELPSPLNREKFFLLKKGIWDNSETNVFINQKKDFTFLFPQPAIEYKKYKPRKKKLDLVKYKNKIIKEENERRYLKISNYINSCKNLLEIGSGEGFFLRLINSKNKKINLFSLEKDTSSINNNKKLKWLVTFNNFRQIKKKFDIICFFHVFEHILKPQEFLIEIKKLMSPNAKIILEVPSLFDPIINLYEVKEYINFFFQSQHPYTYSSNSLKRILEKNFVVENIIYFQRYGIENHLSWLIKKEPGGDKKLNSIYKSAKANYIKDLETSQNTDSVIVVLSNYK